MPSHARRMIATARRGKNEVVWKHIYSFRKQSILDKRLRDLLDQGSLTHRLIKASKGDFRVRVCKQTWQRPHFNERKCLCLKEHEYAFIREVELICKGEVWVKARSVIPRATLVGKLKHLAHLGNKPLGAVLFKNPSLERTSFEVSRLTAEGLIDNSIRGHQEESWGRRSVFRLQGKSILVTEIFLPNCPFLHE